MAEGLSKAIRMIVALDAIEALSQHGEVWFSPGNNGDLGSLMVGDEVITFIRTWNERHDG